MTCGIYRLIFDGTDKCYIGQSVNIERRYMEHVRSLEKGTASKKMMLAYSAYGAPRLDILLDNIDASELDALENEAIALFDSFNNGFNQLEHANEVPTYQVKGPDRYNSKYTRGQILAVFNLLVHTELKQVEISHQTGVSLGTVEMISRGVNHRWLEDEFPVEYTILKNKLNSNCRVKSGHEKQQATNRGIVYPEIVQPSGQIYSVTNVRAFAREHFLDPGALGKVLNRHRNSHKGWKLYE